MDIFDIDQALPYLKQNYVLYCLDSKVILYLQDSMIVLYNEQWHSRIKLEDFLTSFSNCHFQLIEQYDSSISKEKDDEYYQWRYHHQ